VIAAHDPLMVRECLRARSSSVRSGCPEQNPAETHASACSPVTEFAAYLRTDDRASLISIARELVGFKVGWRWSLLGRALRGPFLNDGIDESQLEALLKSLSDPKVWARESKSHPDLWNSYRAKIRGRARSGVHPAWDSLSLRAKRKHVDRHRMTPY